MYSFVNKKILTSLIIALLLLVPIISSASYAAISIEEMIERSNVILIGKVIKESGSLEKGGIEDIKWEVDVKCYLKGDITANRITVLTPGRNFSTHYNLNDWGNIILLYLTKTDEGYIPLTPKAVVPVSFNYDSDIAKMFKDILVIDPKLESADKIKIENFIKISKYKSVEETQQRGKNTSHTNNSHLILLGIIEVAILGVGTVFLIRRNKSL